MPFDVDPNAPARPDAGLFGLDVPIDEAGVRVIPVPFDATTSYRPGTARGPEAILRASHQVDLLCPLFGRTYEAGLVMLGTDPRVVALEEEAFGPARRIVEVGGELGGDPALEAALRTVNEAGSSLNGIVAEHVASALQVDALPVVLGGDHSVPFGAIEVCARAHPGLGVLHVDAHADLRSAYEGFTWSHASILRNVVDRLPAVERIVQVGIRDFCQEELDVIEREGERIGVLFDHDWSRAKRTGADLSTLVRRHLEHLPEHVYVSFDIDGLDPSLCPSTGTPVPGGLDWGDVSLWLEEIVASGRRIVGLDLVEVAPAPNTPDGEDSWDAIVGARLLYRLAGAALRTRS